MAHRQKAFPAQYPAVNKARGDCSGAGRSAQGAAADEPLANLDSKNRAARHGPVAHSTSKAAHRDGHARPALCERAERQIALFDGRSWTIGAFECA